MSETNSDRMPWEKWQRMMQGEWFDGWSFCRFGVRAGEKGDAVFPCGFTRGSFGMFGRPARYFDGFGAPSKGVFPIHHLVHLRSGVIIGSFDRAETLVEAAELADRVADWDSAVEPSDAFYTAAVARSAEAWTAVGILSNSDRSARPVENNDLIQGIVMKMEEHLDRGRPEKLS